MTPLRVWLVVTQLQVGGTERQVELLARGLATAGHQVEVVTLFGGGPVADRLAAAGIVTWCAGLSRSALHAPRTVLGLLRLLSRARRHRPDVVHAFLFEAYVLVPPIARLVGVPVVVAGRRAIGFYKQDRPMLRALERLTAPAAHAVVANSQAVAADVVQNEAMPSAKVVVIPNALSDEALVGPVASADRRERAVPAVVCVANLSSYKGHEDLLAASARLVAAGVPHRLLLVGHGARQAGLERMADELRLEVEFLGSRADVTALLREADVFVLPSHSEGMSNALMEAMAAGLPSVATDVGGNAEVLGGCGLLCRARDPEDLARALAQVLTDAPLRRRLGQAAAARARTAFSEASLVDSHLALYSKLLTDRPKERPRVRD